MGPVHLGMADDVVLDLFVGDTYRGVILPMTVLRQPHLILGPACGKRYFGMLGSIVGLKNAFRNYT